MNESVVSDKDIVVPNELGVEDGAIGKYPQNEDESAAKPREWLVCIKRFGFHYET